MPRWPRSWASFSLLQLYSHLNTWANLHLLFQPDTPLATAPSTRRTWTPPRRAGERACAWRGRAPGRTRGAREPRARAMNLKGGHGTWQTHGSPIVLPFTAPPARKSKRRSAKPHGAINAIVRSITINATKPAQVALRDGGVRGRPRGAGDDVIPSSLPVITSSPPLFL
jgi:hypothetical protein